METQRIASTTKKVGRNQSGMASFLITMVMMLVITLIVVGFSQVSRHNQREALDDQESTQAYYAAETGVNLVQSLMENYSPSQLIKTTCPAGSNRYYSTQLSTQSATNTCLIVDTAPTTLQYGDVGSAASTVVPLQPDQANYYGTGKLTITWQSKSNTGSIANCTTAFGSFPPASSWPSGCPLGVFRFDMVQIGTSLDASTLENNTITVFAPPTQSSRQPMVKSGGSMQGTPGSYSCTDNPTSCTLTINNVNFNGTYYLRLNSLYNDVAISDISGYAGGSTTPNVKFINAQVAIDSTGQSVDVLRRVEVRLDQTSQLTPSNAIQSTSGICKLYSSDSVNPADLSVCNN